jgi:hypothetical protein
MTPLMPPLLSTWSWRLERVAGGRTVLTRGQAATAARDLVGDRAAHPESYAGYEEEFQAAVDALTVLAQQPNRSDDLLGVLAAERRGRDRDRADAGLTPVLRTRSSTTAEHDRVPRGLPDPLDRWVHRLIRHRNGMKHIDPIEASRAEVELRNEASLHPGLYRYGVVAAYLERTLRELGDLATRERPEPAARYRFG